jgi:hypothetical protein
MIDEPIVIDFNVLREDDEKAVAEQTFADGKKLTIQVYKSKFDKSEIGNGNGLAYDVEFIKLRYSKEIK